MKHFFLIANKKKDPERIHTDRIVSFLKANGATCKVAEPMPRDDQKKEYTDPAVIPKETECILVLGGDGTLLRAARDTHELHLPLLGINLGTVGYLAEVEINDIEQALLGLLEDRYQIEDRMMLKGALTTEEGRYEDLALNDVVITREGGLQIIQFDIYVNQSLLGSFSADGVIVSTPTGSTGYNLSAGGPLVQPGAKTLLITPICAHTLSSRSIVLSADQEIRIVITKGHNGQNQTLEARFDGSGAFRMASGDQVDVVCADTVTRIVKLNRQSFLKVLQQKMRSV